MSQNSLIYGYEKHGDAFLELEVTVVIKYFIGFVVGIISLWLLDLEFMGKEERLSTR